MYKIEYVYYVIYIKYHIHTYSNTQWLEEGSGKLENTLQM